MMADPFTFQPLTKRDAQQITCWQYEAPYVVYNMGEDSIRTLLDGSYYVSKDEQGQCIGYCCHGEEARVPGGYLSGVYTAYDDESEGILDIGLGLAPYWTGKGNGERFVRAVLTFFATEHRKYRFRLVVLSFNQRAKTVYERVGFVETMCFVSPVQGKEMKFVAMEMSMQAQC